MGIGKRKKRVQFWKILVVDWNGDKGPFYEAVNQIVCYDFPTIIGVELVNNPVSTFGCSICFGHYVSEPEFYIILRSIVRPITSQIYFHHDQIKLGMIVSRPVKTTWWYNIGRLFIWFICKKQSNTAHGKTESFVVFGKYPLNHLRSLIIILWKKIIGILLISFRINF